MNIISTRLSDASLIFPGFLIYSSDVRRVCCRYIRIQIAAVAAIALSAVTRCVAIHCAATMEWIHLCVPGPGGALLLLCPTAANYVTPGTFGHVALCCFSSNADADAALVETRV